MFSSLSKSLFNTGTHKFVWRGLSTMAQRMNQDIAKNIINNVDNFLFDCDGVLWDGKGTIEGSLDTILKLKGLGKRIFYVSNNSSQTRHSYAEKCRKQGFPATEDDIVCTAYVAAQYLHKINFKDKVYLLGRPESIGVELERAGIRHIGTGPDPLVGEDYNDWLSSVKLDQEVKCVMVGFDPHISYMKILKAASYLKNPDCLFIATNEDGTLPVKDSDIVIPGTGCIVQPVKTATEREPMVMGKPHTYMFEILRKVHKLDPSRCMMTGDRISTDIVFGQNCGIRSLLVLSGSATIDDIRQTNKEVKETAEMLAGQPEIYALNLAEFGKYI